MSISTVRVPPEGPEDAKIMVVGEAPGAQETKFKRPFVGISGSILRNALERGGLDAGGAAEDLDPRLSSEVWLTNLCKHQPPRNDFTKLLRTPELALGLAELKEEIATIKPNVIVAAGAWPLYFLTGKTNDAGQPGTGILNWRGSIVPSRMEVSMKEGREIDEAVNGRKVIASLHPAFLTRTPSMSPIFQFDIKRACEDAGFPELNVPEFEYFIDPPPEELDGLLERHLAQPYLSVDIETDGSDLACLGISGFTDSGICLTRSYARLEEYARTILESSTPKVFQYGTYDINWLRRFRGWSVSNYAWDTYVATASLYPEFPRRLQFLVSIYTRIPYYKDEGKTWKKSPNVLTRWLYNIKDVCATLMIRDGQEPEMKELYG